MKNADKPANPVPSELEGYCTDHKTCTRFEPFMGMTKREEFAKAAMQGLCSFAVEHTVDDEVIAEWSVNMADALLDELECRS